VMVQAKDEQQERQQVNHEGSGDGLSQGSVDGQLHWQIQCPNSGSGANPQLSMRAGRPAAVSGSVAYGLTS